jgi:hypothetical protein
MIRKVENGKLVANTTNAPMSTSAIRFTLRVSRDGDVELPGRDVEPANGVEAGGGCSEERDGGDGGWGWEGGTISFSNRRKCASSFFGHVVLEPSLKIRVMTTKNRAE